MVIFSETSVATITIKNRQLTSNMVYVNGNFLNKNTYYIPLEMSRKAQFNGNVFKNVDWNYYYGKHETIFKHVTCQGKTFINNNIL